MAEYVSEMATRVVMPNTNVNTAFRKFVSQILTSTRLPRTTILLGMNYLSKRVNPLTSSRQWNPTEGQIWRMLTIALLLGSKFLDDNTFQNKSWSEVSGIPVQELNTLEYEWLASINWCLYVNLDKSEDYKAWLDNWKEWLESKKRRQAQANRAQVPPIDTELARTQTGYYAWHQRQVAELERYSSMKRNQVSAAPGYCRDPAVWPYNMAWPQSAPLTPPDSGYCTPEYSNSATSVNSHYTEWFDRALVGNNNVSRHYQQPVAYGGYQQGGHQSLNTVNPGSFYKYGHNIWEQPPVTDCNCHPWAACNGHHVKPAGYFHGHGYGMPVVG